jgi:TolB-like protein/Tfp pilus assembly protein PilF
VTELAKLPPDDGGPRLFVSHASADAARARQLVEALQAAGCQVWWDGMLTGGEAFQSSIETMLHDADAVIVLWSKQANDSHWVRDEAAVGRDRGRLIPLSLDASLPPLGFRQLHVIDLSGWNGKADANAFAQVLAAVASVAGRAPATPTPKRVAGAAAPSSGINRRWLIGGGAGLAVAAAAGGWVMLRPGPVAAGSIAVLPFRNMSGQASDDYFAEGLAEELRTTLALNRQLLVSGAASAGGFRGSEVDPRQIASKLGVTSLLMGTVRPAAGRVRIATRLIDGTTGLERWSQSFDRSVSDVLAVQAEIATTVADALLSSLARDDGWQARRPGATTNSTAFDHYLKGQALYQAAASDQSDRAALAQYDAAIAADPRYAAAHAARARCLVTIANNGKQATAAARQRDQALAAARRAIALAPDMAEGHSALGYLMSSQLDLAAARDPYARALELGLGNAPILASCAEFSAQTGDFAVARTAVSRAALLDPLNPRVFRSRGLVEFNARAWPEARTAFTSALRLQPDMDTVHSLLGDMALVQGDAAAARGHYEQEHGAVSRMRSLAIIDAKQRGRAAGAVHMDRLIREFGDAVHFQRAEVLAQWGETEAALISLEQALALRDPGLVLAAHDPMLDPLRLQPRFQAVLRQIGVAPPVGQSG